MLRSALRLAFALTVLAAAAIPARAQSPEDAGSALYSRYCVGCHGPQLRGGTAANLMVPKLKHGEDRDSIYRSIAEGVPDFGMPAYGETMSKAQLTALTDFVLARRAGSDAVAPPPPPRAWTGRGTAVVDTLDYRMKVEVWAEKLATPWALDFVDADRALVTEKGGTLRLLTRGRADSQIITGTPAVTAEGQGGMLEVAIDPDFAKTPWIYLAFSHPLDDGRSMTKVVRGKLKGTTWTEEQVLYQAPEKTYRPTHHHFGSRIVFDDAGHLFFAIGDRGIQKEAQNLSFPGGKVHRIRRDGSVPKDNPFVGREGALPTIYSYGHRNPQGLDIHPVTGALWDAEHGPRGGDELNIVRAGANYGWPLISYGINYNGKIITRERVQPGLEQPVYFWRPSIAVCNIAFYRGAEFPYWQNHLLVSSLAGQQLLLLTVEEGRVLHSETLLSNRGRIRDVSNGPDGAIYVVLNDPGSVLRLSSAGEAIR